MSLPTHMRCIEIAGSASSNTLVVAQRPVPQPGKNEVLIKVAAAGINRPDIFQREGLYPPPEGASDILGLEVAGEIIAVGKNQTSWRVGQQVCALLAGGGYSEYAVADPRLCLPVPPSLNLIQAAALPEAFFTVWQTVFQRAAIQPGETLLVHGGTSGIGTTAIQLAKALGHRVFTTASSEKKCRQCLKLGADTAINYQKQDFVAVIKNQTAGYGVDVILDMVGGDYLQKNIRSAAFRGRIISIAFLRGSKVEIDMMPVMLKQLVLTGSTLRSRPAEEKSSIAKTLLAKVWPLLENGTIKPVIDTTFPLEEADKAHRLMASNKHIGKIVLTL